MLFFQGYWREWRVEDHPFKWDKAHYYSYLPSVLINGNLDFDYEQCPELTVAPNGGKVPKVTYGMALMYSPFFLLGHKIAINQKSPLTGFSEPYSTVIHYGSLFYLLAGFFMLALVLRRFFSDLVCALTIGLLFFATNLFYYSLREGEMAHIYCFFLISALMLLTCRWHENPRNRTLLLMGFVTGLLTLIRPTEIIILLFVVLYDVRSFHGLWDKLRTLFLRHYWGLILFSVAAFIMWIPQMWFWKIKTDHFLFFSYSSEESFFWFDPKVINVLFSYRKGLLIYTPLMLGAFVGFFLLKDRLQKLKAAVVMYFFINLYLVSSWWCWWYGGGFGMRSLVQSYAILAIPLATFLHYIFNFDYRKYLMAPALRFITVVFVSGCLCLNIVQTYQYSQGMIHWDSMTREAYWYAFDKFYYVYEDVPTLNRYFKSPDYGAAIKGHRD